MNNDNTKVCSKCKIEKPKEAFYKRAGSKDGLRTECRECENSRSRSAYNSNPEYHRTRASNWRNENPEKHSASKRAWKKANPDKVKAYEKKHYQNNSEKIIERTKKYYLNNRDKVLETKRIYQQKNAELIREYKKQWSMANSEKVSDARHRYRTKKHENGIFKIRNKFLKRLYASPCVNCGATDNMSADHIIPVAKGGVHSEGNLQPLCIPCNSSKQDKYMMEWRMKQ